MSSIKNRPSFVPGLLPLFLVMLLCLSACPDLNSTDPADSDPIVDKELSGSIRVTPPEPVAGTELSAVYSGSETVSYQWKKDGETVGTDSSKCRAIKPGTYTVTVSAQGYKNKTSADVTVYHVSVDIPAFTTQLTALGDTTIDKPITVKPAGGGIDDVLKEMDTAITNAKKYIILDLSLCYAEGDSITGGYSTSSPYYLEPTSRDMNYLADNEFIKGIILPSTLKTIGEYAFCNCDNLTSITIPEGVTTIGEYAFYDSDNVIDITIPEGVATIGNSAFSSCNSLTSITIPEGVTSIGGGLFPAALTLPVSPSPKALQQ